MNQDIDVNIEPLPGYRLIERLGAGGYGEVWRAQAPGGLTKAIKFVFGNQHEKRASNELRALEHVRGVRHPFLLSLERAEIVNGRLLIVTELADKSVKDRFDSCRREGQSGIPREELLGYLRDAADALDFMSESHALQHLDIKPENLLILAGHVKVADFGLVKDMRQSQGSLVGGMTPLYASPEVFRGTPSRHSDQYSLAILYQEMLTGTLPFAGSNAAELTLQHLNDEPDLSALSGGDRYAVSRALSKDPEHRYSTCRAFVEALARVSMEPPQLETKSYGDVPVQPLQYESEPSFEVKKTEFFDDDESPWQSQPQLLPELPPTDCRIQDLPAIELKTVDGRLTPTVVIGIGGTATRVLAQLRRSIHELYSGSAVPALQLLALDTDARGLSSVASGGAGHLTADETLALPLRRPQHYRDNSQQLLHWLSRRWLYNIPRSMRTEGLRPLGRLALVDHARQVGQRIRRAILQALDPQAIGTSTIATGKRFREDQVRVVVVASICGGTGGGISLDIGYAVRAILQKIGVPKTRIVGIAMHSTDRDARRSELARVNAYSWLSEFNHFAQVDNAYPGDASCGLPPQPAGVPAFDQTYLLHLGDGLDPSELDQAAQSVADYLRLDSLTAAGAFFEVCRGDQQRSENGITALRSFGVVRRSAGSSEFCDRFAADITQHVLLSWVGASRSSPQAAAAATASANFTTPDFTQFTHRMQLDAARLVANAGALLSQQFGPDASTFAVSWLDKTDAISLDLTSQLRAIDQIFSARYEGAIDGEISVLNKPVSGLTLPLSEKLRSELRRWITRRLDEPRQRLEGARSAINCFGKHLLEIHGQLQHHHSALDCQINQMNNSAISAASTNAKAAASQTSENNLEYVCHYFEQCRERTATFAARQIVCLLLSDVKAMSDELTSLGREISQIAATIDRASTVAATGDSACKNYVDEDDERLATLLAKHREEIAAHVDARLQEEYLDPIGGLSKTIMQGGRPRAQLSVKLHQLSRQAVDRASAAVDLLGIGTGNETAAAGVDLKSVLSLATPALLEFGGTRRIVAVLPRDADVSSSEKAIASQLGTAVTIISGDDSRFTLCVEADALPLPHLALDLVERRRDRIDFAGRVHCRSDISWTPLVSAEPREQSFWPQGDNRQTQTPLAVSKTLVI